MKYIWILIFGFPIVTLTGCTTIYEGKYDFSDGWREAQVIQIGPAAEIATPQFSDCRKTALPQQLAMGKFVVLSYRHLSRPRKRVVPLRPGDSFHLQEFVYMNVTNCDEPLIPRSKKVE